MRAALFIAGDHDEDRTGILASLPELLLLSRALDQLSTVDLDQDEQRRARAMARQIKTAIDTAKDAAETDHVCLDRIDAGAIVAHRVA